MRPLQKLLLETVIALFVGVPVYGWAVWCYWGWFVVPVFDVSVLTFKQSIYVSQVMSLPFWAVYLSFAQLRDIVDPTGSHRDHLSYEMLKRYVVIAMMVGIGWVIRHVWGAI